MHGFREMPDEIGLPLFRKAGMPCFARARRHLSSPGSTSRHGLGRDAYTPHAIGPAVPAPNAAQRGEDALVPAIQAMCGVTCSTIASGRPADSPQ